MSGEFKRHLVSTFNADLIIPIYSVLLPLLAYRLGGSVFEVGLVGAAANGVYCFMPFVMGRIADRDGVRLFFVTSSFAILGVVSVSYVFIQSPVTLIVARVFEGIGWAMLWPAIEAAIRDSMPDAKRALSIFNFTWSGGAAIGPLVGLAIIFFTTLRTAFVITSILMFVTLLLNIGSLLKVHGHTTFVKEVSTDAVPSVGPDRRFGSKFYIPSMTLAAVSSGVLYTFLGAYAGSISMPLTLVLVSTFMFGFARFLMYLLTMKERFRSFVLFRKNRARNTIVSLIVMSLSSLLVLVRDPTGIIYLAAYGIAGAGYSMVYVISQTAVIADAGPKTVGRSAGLFESSIGIGQFFGPALAGAISGTSLSMPFVFPSVSLVVFLVAMPFITRKRNSVD
ncbi:MAG: MFS transporter [Nitrososphaerota archaeon]|nr:MFS transporter [Nitrososphaerota archaeon]MDG6922445.1 MFS transporter [Nitrososphaerota archaeon]